MIQCAAAFVLVLASTRAAAALVLGPEEIVQAGGGSLIVAGYSAPSFAAWNGDALKDLIIGEGGGVALEGKVRVYLNTGTPSAPQFGNYFYAQSGASDLIVPAGGCLGAFPRVAYWDADARKDLLVGQSDGKVKLFLNVGSEGEPRFDAGTFVNVGEIGLEIPIDVGERATPVVTDWNNDGKKDLVVGGLDGKLRLFLNEGEDSAPRFIRVAYAVDNGGDLVVPSGRSSPHVRDLDGDGKKDVLAGNTEGELLLYRNTGTDAAPSFSGWVRVEADGVAINFPGTPRTRPFICEWTDDGFPDVLIGAGDGYVHLFAGVAGSGIDDDGPLPAATSARLLATYPNPFTAETRISFVLSAAQSVRLLVHDVSGRRVAVLAQGLLPGGAQQVTWTGRDEAGRPSPAGVYFLRMETDHGAESARLIICR